VRVPPPPGGAPPLSRRGGQGHVRPAYSGILEALSEPDFLSEAELAALKAPLRLVWGACDRLLPEGTLDFFRRALPRADVVLLQNAGHLPHLETPRALVRALLAPFPG